jgi:hypothetical protein
VYDRLRRLLPALTGLAALVVSLVVLVIGTALSAAAESRDGYASPAAWLWAAVALAAGGSILLIDYARARTPRPPRAVWAVALLALPLAGGCATSPAFATAAKVVAPGLADGAARYAQRDATIADADRAERLAAAGRLKAAAADPVRAADVADAWGGVRPWYLPYVDLDPRLDATEKLLRHRVVEEFDKLIGAEMARPFAQVLAPAPVAAPVPAAQAPGRLSVPLPVVPDPTPSPVPDDAPPQP